MTMRPVILFLLVACGGHPAAPQAPPPDDLVSVITIPGRATPEGMDWGDKGKLPAKQLQFKNLQLLGDVTGDRLMAAMQSMKASLGQSCKLCHGPPDWASDAKPAKKRARQMIEMANAINAKFFKGVPRVTCLTCHRGATPPPKVIEPTPDQFRKPKNPPPALAAADEDKPAGEVYKNIQSFKQMPAKQLLFVMGLFTADLGVECEHCHVDGDWPADTKPPKQRAREMMELVGFVAKTYFPDKPQTPVGCAFCHRGKVKPPHERVE